MEVKNAAGETVFEGQSEAECARWWIDAGRRGDSLADTGEQMETVAAVTIDAQLRGYDRYGCPVFYSRSAL